MQHVPGICPSLRCSVRPARGRGGLASAAGLARVTAAGLETAGADPEVAGDVAQLGVEGHGLGEVADRLSRGRFGLIAPGRTWVAHGKLLCVRALGKGLVPV